MCICAYKHPALRSYDGRHVAGLRKGSFVITLTKRLPSRDFEICEYEMHEMSWGTATVYIQQKVTEARDYNSDEYDSENDI